MDVNNDIDNTDIDTLIEVDLSCYDISGVSSNVCSESSETELQLHPVLSVMARDYLAISASAVPCESTFSGGRRSNRWDRSRLSSETVQATETFKSWSKDFDLEDSFQK